MPQFRIVDVPQGSEERIEQLGTKAKFWFRHPELGDCLCKITRPGTGEDWSEKVAAEIAHRLALPHANYELGIFQDAPCVVSPRFLPQGCNLVHGNELLGRADPSYRRMNVRRFRAVAHTLDAVWEALNRTACDLPLNWMPPNGIKNSSDVFAGYLLLDAVIGNTDRHDENWGIVEEAEQATDRRHLAPTFDHASCLGCHLTDAGREDRLSTRDAGFTPESFATRARSAFFPGVRSGKPISTMEAYQKAAERYPEAVEIWLKKLRAIRPADVDEIFACLPQQRCTPPASQFAKRVLLHNIERTLTLRT